MKLTVDSGLWALGSEVEAPPEVAVLEVSGAVLAWTIHDAAQVVRITFTDLPAADWLWRLVGEAGHVAVVAAAETATEAGSVDLADVLPLPEPLAALRRLAVGHWLRRWWPASARDGIARSTPRCSTPRSRCRRRCRRTTSARTLWIRISPDY